MNFLTGGGTNMKGTIYGNRLQRGTQVKKGGTHVKKWCTQVKKGVRK